MCPVSVLLLLLFIRQAASHAIFWEPASRATLGHRNGNQCNLPVDYDHMSLYCGGASVQHSQNGGKCGICGDPYGAPNRPHEVPGLYANGVIGRSYLNAGQVIDVTIDVVANHKGFFAFKLCVNNNILKDPDASCFVPLKYEDGSDFHFLDLGPQVRGQRFDLRLKLPDGVTCWQCILQWTYTNGNSWGVGRQSFDYATPDCINSNEGKVGCGPQETFRGCADICIGPECPTEPCQKARPFSTISISPSTSTTTTTQIPTSTTIPALPDQLCIKTSSKKPYDSLLGSQYCQFICFMKPIDVCNLFICSCQTAYSSKVY